MQHNMTTRNIDNKTLNSLAPAYQKKKALKALKEAKKKEEQEEIQGKKWCLLADGKTKVLR